MKGWERLVVRAVVASCVGLVAAEPPTPEPPVQEPLAASIERIVQRAAEDAAHVPLDPAARPGATSSPAATSSAPAPRRTVWTTWLVGMLASALAGLAVYLSQLGRL